ncbi:MAG: ABC transporter permease [Verrucomicrobia bacterium]|nr:ABC transporter permease [Verrucomicrobiota bacterium]
MSRLGGTMLAMEWRQTFRRYRALVWCLIGLSVVALAVALAGMTVGPGRRATAVAVFEMLAGAHFCLVAMLGPALGSLAVAEERSHRTAGLLSLTDLSGWDVVWGKFASRAALLLLVFAAGAPVVLTAALLGAPGDAQVGRLLMTAAAAGVSGLAIGLVTAMIVPRASQAVILSFFAVLMWFVILPSAVQLVWLELRSTNPVPLWIDAWSPLYAFHHELLRVWPAPGWSRCGASLGTALALAAALVAASGRMWRPARLRAWEQAELSAEPIEGDEPQTRSRRRLAAAGRFTPAGAAAFFLVMFTAILLVSRPRMSWAELSHGMAGVYFPVCWFLVDLAAALYAAHAFAVQKQDGALELLASTPLTNAALVWNELARLMRKVSYVPATLAGCQLALWAAGGEPKLAEASSVLMLAGTPVTVATRVFHYYLVMVGALWLSAWSRNLTRAILAAMVVFVGFTWACAAVSESALNYITAQHLVTAPHGLRLCAALALGGALARVAAAAVLQVWLIRGLRRFASRRA